MLLAADRLERATLDAENREVLERRAQFAFRLEIARRIVDVRFDDRNARDAFAARFERHRSKRKPEFAYYVASRDALYLWSDRSQAWRWPDGVANPEATAFLADAAVVSAIVRSDPSLVSLHASVVSHHDRIVAIGGDSWSGKSTTAIACVGRKMQFYSDERLLLRDGIVYPFQRTCSLRPHGRALLSADGIDAPTLTPVDRSRAVNPGPLSAIFMLAGCGARANVRRIEHYEATPSLFRWMDSREGDFKRLARLVALLARVPCFALELGTPSESANAIAETVEGLTRDVA